MGATIVGCARPKQGASHEALPGASAPQRGQEVVAKGFTRKAQVRTRRYRSAAPIPTRTPPPLSSAAHRTSALPPPPPFLPGRNHGRCQRLQETAMLSRQPVSRRSSSHNKEASTVDFSPPLVPTCTRPPSRLDPQLQAALSHPQHHHAV